MPAVCLYFQLHQPYRLKRYTYLNVGRDHSYFDDEKNGAIFRKVAKKCYIPAAKILLELIQKYDGNFRCAFSITGTAIDQMEKYSPEALEGFIELARTGCVEFLAETYHHTLASLYDPLELSEQVGLHSRLMEKYFGKKPSVFRNTELIYDDRIGKAVYELGFRGVLAEGADDVLDWRSPNCVYRHPEVATKLLLKNYRLSDDIAFRFSDRNWSGYPLTASKFADSLRAVEGNGDYVGIFVDFETFGEHQWEATGIFDFLRELPAEVLKNEEWSFLTPSQVLDRYDVVSELSFKRTTSWADVARDTSAWRGNRMQGSALKQIYEALFELVPRGIADSERIETWRRLQTSDHFYYMSTKTAADGDVHSYFSPYESPYDAFIAYMNVLRDFRASLEMNAELVR